LKLNIHAKYMIAENKNNLKKKTLANIFSIYISACNLDLLSNTFAIFVIQSIY